MTAKHKPLLKATFFMLLALTLWCGQAVAQPSASSFDQTYRTLFGRNSYDRTPVYYLQLIRKLRTELPADDLPRALRLLSAECADNAWWNQPSADRIQQLTRALASVGQDHLAHARLLICQAGQESSEGRDSLALQSADKAVAFALRSGDPIVMGDALALRANYRSSLGNQPSALIDYAESTRVLDEAGVTRMPLDLVYGRARAYRRLGDLVRARQYIEEYGKAARSSNDTMVKFAYLLERSFIDLDANDPRGAKRYAEQALAVLPADDALLRGNALLARARANVDLGHYQAALDDLAQISADTGSPVDRALESLVRGQAYHGLGRSSQALSSLESALQKFKKDSNPRYLAWLYRVRADAHEAAGNPVAALADFREHIRLRDHVTTSMAGQQEALRNMEQAVRIRAAENSALRKEKAALERVKRWQASAIALGGLFIALLGYIIYLQMRRSRRLRKLADFDALTHVASRAHILSAGETAVRRAHAQCSPLCVLMLDIDHFKAVNDSHGHPFGDEVLTQVARACQKALRANDLLGRTGGEEFLVICRDTALQDARRIAERILKTVQTLPSKSALSGLDSLTVSIGVAQLNSPDEDLQGLVQRADEALYQAKNNGRNRVELAE